MSDKKDDAILTVDILRKAKAALDNIDEAFRPELKCDHLWHSGETSKEVRYGVQVCKECAEWIDSAKKEKL